MIPGNAFGAQPCTVAGRRGWHAGHRWVLVSPGAPHNAFGREVRGEEIAAMVRADVPEGAWRGTAEGLAMRLLDVVGDHCAACGGTGYTVCTFDLEPARSCPLCDENGMEMCSCVPDDIAEVRLLGEHFDVRQLVPLRELLHAAMASIGDWVRTAVWLAGAPVEFPNGEPAPHRALCVDVGGWRFILAPVLPSTGEAREVIL